MNMSALFITTWNVIHRLKIPFVLIFYSMNYVFLKKYGCRDPHILLSSFTLLNFSMHMLNNYFDLKEDTLTNQASFLSKRSALLSFSTAPFLIGLSLVIVNGYSLLCYGVLALLMLSYSMPLFNGKRIKDILFIKNITGSLFWWYIPFTLITSIHTANSFSDVFLSNIFILATFMPFEPLWDIKDRQGDQAAGIKTIPNTYGVDATKLLVCSCFGLLGIIKAGTLNSSSVTLFLPLAVFVSLIKEDSPLWVYQLMILFLPAHIMISIIFG